MGRSLAYTPESSSTPLPNHPMSMKRRVFLVGTLAATAGCLDYFEDEEREELTNPSTIVIVWDRLVRYDEGTDEERVSIWGVVRDDGDRELSYIELRATFLDADGEELERVIENVRDVTAGEEWTFDIEFPRHGEEARAVQSYELDVITGL